MTTRQQERTAAANYNAWLNSDNYDIEQAYKTCSTAKYNAWRYCRELCNKFNGYALKVVNFNTFVFTAGFEFIDAATGVVKFAYITPSYDTIIDAPSA